MKPSSPCIDICQIDAKSRLCIGCLRSMDEIAAWGSLPETERLAIMASLPARKTDRDAEPRP
ncbi:DUF1289 domain-containing protein [Paracoccus sp. MBLB3053]|uniref:DUF1289 domain-containing protein n=1 Tax=Paracoccus aurantius TaxID=3073814 RepID=A0ABU2HRH5_9RHOB|nr:DUF1289 domain-containing protein [Paracoccus sp. MBLB3053]MDS9467135.1 DUF1289 domain-containing protein [Paracoccus sp. MBLB3053]